MPIEDNITDDLAVVSTHAVVRTDATAAVDLSAVAEAMLRVSPDPVFVVDRAERYLHVGEAGARALGLPASAIIGKAAHEFGLAPEVAADLAVQIERVFRTKQPYTDTARPPMAIGLQRYEHHFSPVFGADGEVTAVLCLARDMTHLTERKQAEDRLKESEERFRAVFDNTAVGVALMTPEGHIVKANPAYGHMLGYSVQELIGKSFQELTHPDDVKADTALRREILERRRDTYTLEKRYLRQDGSLIWAHLSVGAERNANGTLRFFVAVINDITARRQAEEEARRSYQRLAYHFENTPLAVVEWDERGRVRHWSAGAERVFGWTAAEIVGKHFDDWQFIHEEDAQTVRATAARLLEGKEPRNFHYNRNYTKSGRVIHCEWYNSVLRGEDGSWMSMLSLALDVTDRKRTEAQLVQAQKMESIGRLAGGIAHDYNNLLAVILGYAEVVEDGLAPNSEMLANLHNIQGAANRAATLTRQLLAFARRQPSQLEVVAPNDLLRAFMDLLKPLLTATVELLLLPGENVGNIEIDPNHLEQIVMNLAVNARDAMPQGGKLILKTENVTFTEPRLTEAVEVLPGTYVRFSVTDTGIGMTETVRQHIFEPFFTTKEKSRGTGLGLATVYGLVKQAKGYIWAYSEVGMGTTFHIYLPVVNAVPVAPTAEEPPLASGGTERVLVVEDEPLVRELTVNTLRKAGYTVLVAANGVEGLRVFTAQTEPLDLVVTDAIMPIMGGRELLERLRALQPDVRVLIASGYSEEGYADRVALPAGVGFLQKPFTARALLEKVRQALNA